MKRAFGLILAVILAACDSTPPNTPPQVVETIPDMRIRTNGFDSLVASDYFSDPDGDRLAYDAESADPGVVTIHVEGDVVTLSTGASAGDTEVTIVATDEYGDSAFQSFNVEVFQAGAFRDDFATSASLDDWTEHWLRAQVVDSMLVLDNEEVPDTFPRTPHVYRSVFLSDGWTISGSFAVHGETAIATVLVFTDHSTYRVWSFDYHYSEDKWGVFLYQGDGQWLSVGEGEITLKNDELSLWTWSLDDNDVMTLVVEGDEIVDRDLSERLEGETLDVVGVGLGFYVGREGVVFDFVEIR